MLYPFEPQIPLYTFNTIPNVRVKMEIYVTPAYLTICYRLLKYIISHDQAASEDVCLSLTPLETISPS